VLHQCVGPPVRTWLGIADMRSCTLSAAGKIAVQGLIKYKTDFSAAQYQHFINLEMQFLNNSTHNFNWSPSVA